MPGRLFSEGAIDVYQNLRMPSYSGKLGNQMYLCTPHEDGSSTRIFRRDQGPPLMGL